MAATSRAAKQAMNATPRPRSRKPPAFNMAMALRIREGLNVNAKPLIEGPGSLRVMRYLEPKFPEEGDAQKGSEDSPQKSSNTGKRAEVASSVAITKTKKPTHKFMSIKELNEQIAAANSTEPASSAHGDPADAVHPKREATKPLQPQQAGDRAGLLTLEHYMQEDVLFVSIDTEMVQDPENSRYGVTEVGMCLLDTRDLRQLDEFGMRGDNVTQLFDAHHFGLYKNQEALDGKEGNAIRARIPSHSWKYIFGKAAVKWIPTSRIEREMSKLIYQKLGSEMSRKVVFLYFDKTLDMQYLNKADVFLTEEFPNHEIIDTQWLGVAAVVAKILGQPRATAAAVYDYLGVPTTLYENTYSRQHTANKQHTAGNDAIFQMQAWVAGLCLKDEHWEPLHRGEKLRPEMKRAWERTSMVEDPVAAIEEEVETSKSSEQERGDELAKS